MARREDKNLFQKLTQLFKSGAVVKRKVRTLDTTVAVADKTKSSGALLFQKSMAPTYATITANAYNLSERLMRYQDFCLTGDTLVSAPTKEGSIRIDELVKRWENGERDLWTFSYDVSTKCVVASMITGAKCNGIKEIVEVTLDDGSTIRCTPDHRFMLKDGSYAEAQDLLQGTALMNFSRADFGTPYRYIQTKKNGWKPEHVLVAEAAANRKCCLGEHVHHRNFQHRDNLPNNLEIMSAHDHMSLHAKINNIRFQDPVCREHMSNVMKSRWESSGDLRKNLQHSLELTREGKRQRRIEFNKSFKPGRYNKNREDQKHLQNANADRTFTFQTICNSFTKSDTLESLSKKLKTSEYKIKNRLLWEGYKSFEDFSKSYENHKVVSVIHTGKSEFVYDIEVAGYSNFAICKKDMKLGSQGIVFVHNCEMEYTAEIASALDIYADETCAQDEKGRILHVYSENEKIKEILEDLFYNTLNTEFNLRSWTRNLVKYGDLFLFNDVSPTHGIINAFPIPTNEIEREENYDPNDPMAVRFRWVTLGNRTLENWEVSHFRLLGNDMFLPYGSSVIEPARRIWRQLILIEDAMLVYRVVRAPERRVFYIDVANIPPENVPMYVEEQRKALRSNQVIDRNTGRVDLRYNPLCLSLHTLIKLQDGRVLDLSTLIKEWESGKQDQWVYSIDPETLTVVPGKVSWAGITRKDAELVRVHLDDGTWRDTTPDHRFMLRDGTYKKAEDLSSGESLMPLYVKQSSKEDGDKIVGYEKVYDPRSSTYLFTHRINAKFSTLNKKLDISKYPIVHHADFNKMNNNPSNLLWMNYFEHSNYHSTMCEKTLNSQENIEKRIPNLIIRNKSSKKRNQVIEANKRNKNVNAMSWYNGSEIHSSHNEIRRQAQIKSWVENKQKRSKAMRWDITDEMFDRLVEVVKNNPKLGREKVHNILMNDAVFVSGLKKQSLKRDINKFSYMSWQSDLMRRGFNGLVGLRESIVGYKNHKVVRVERLSNREDTGCINVEVYHNFAAGPTVDQLNDEQQIDNSWILLHNSVDEDYFIPVRGSDSGTRIDTLAGGQNTAAVEDVAYIQKKLFAALKIPRAYLGYDEALSSKSTLAQEDIRFSRTIGVIQKTMIAELNKLAIIHLYANGFDAEDLQNFTLRLSNPSTVAQQQKLELWRAKFEIAGSAPEGFVDKNFVRKNIWGLNSEECDTIDNARLKDKMVDASIESATSEGGEEGGGGEDLFGGGGGGEEAGGEEAAAGGEEGGGGGGEDLFAADDVEDKEPELSLLTSADDPDDDEDFPVKLGVSREVPIKAQTQLDKALYNRSRIRHHGASKTHEPDFGKMVSSNNKSMTDVYDNDFIKSYVSNPFGESVTQKTMIGSDVMSALKNMKSHFEPQARANHSPQVLSENIDEADEKEHNEVLVIDEDDE